MNKPRRFEALFIDDAAELFPYLSKGFGDFRYVLIEFDSDEKPVRVVGMDGGEPEDQSLVRDWSWVEDELNNLVEKYESRIEQLIDGIEEALNVINSSYAEDAVYYLQRSLKETLDIDEKEKQNVIK